VKGASPSAPAGRCQRIAGGPQDHLRTPSRTCIGSFAFVSVMTLDENIATMERLALSRVALAATR
jgi:hypothetical protein